MPILKKSCQVFYLKADYIIDEFSSEELSDESSEEEIEESKTDETENEDINETSISKPKVTTATQKSVPEQTTTKKSTDEIEDNGRVIMPPNNSGDDVSAGIGGVDVITDSPNDQSSKSEDGQPIYIEYPNLIFNDIDYTSSKDAAQQSSVKPSENIAKTNIGKMIGNGQVYDVVNSNSHRVEVYEIKGVSINEAVAVKSFKYGDNAYYAYVKVKQ